MADVKALIAFFETSHDMTCIEDVVHMVMRAVSQKPILASFLEQVNSLGGCHIFLNLLQRYAMNMRSLIFEVKLGLFLSEHTWAMFMSFNH